MTFHNPRQVLRRYGLQPKKSWGQNFLVDPNTLERIVKQLGIEEGDEVVEFGAGTGVLTRMLAAEAKHVHAVERDRDLVELLEQEMAEEPITIIPADAATFQLAELSQNGRLLVIGNLPYQISTPILFSLLEQHHLFRRLVIMVQKEVADRLVAKPKSGKNYGVLSVRFGAYFRVKRAFNVSAKAFYPRPQVQSTIVTMEPHDTPPPIQDDAWFARTVKASFAQRRKTLQNNLVSGFPELDKQHILALLEEVEISPQLRSETLTVPQFVALAEAIRCHIEADAA